LKAPCTVEKSIQIGIHPTAQKGCDEYSKGKAEKQDCCFPDQKNKSLHPNNHSATFIGNATIPTVIKAKKYIATLGTLKITSPFYLPQKKGVAPCRLWTSVHSMNEPASHNLVTARTLSFKAGRYAAMGVGLAIGLSALFSVFARFSDVERLIHLDGGQFLLEALFLGSGLGAMIGVSRASTLLDERAAAYRWILIACGVLAVPMAVALNFLTQSQGIEHPFFLFGNGVTQMLIGTTLTYLGIVGFVIYVRIFN
jgi:hypothetical protein